jgi:hypothetical protein
MSSERQCSHVYPGRTDSDLYISNVQQHLYDNRMFMPDLQAQMWPSGPCPNTMQGPEPTCPPQFFCTNSVCPPQYVHSAGGYCENMYDHTKQVKATFIGGNDVM